MRGILNTARADFACPVPKQRGPLVRFPALAQLDIPKAASAWAGSVGVTSIVTFGR